MSILIKGMEMPCTCWCCELGCIVNCAQWKNHTGEIVLDKKTKRHPDCPLVPVPTHGRLIDADALDSSATDYSGNHLVYLVDIDDAHTIIPAEEGET